MVLKLTAGWAVAAVVVVVVSAVARGEVESMPRSAHWVIRSSSLEKTLGFLTTVLDMRVLRHEENPEACPITCNGNYATAWSKTMVGYATEDQAYALEVTYNYGVHEYRVGTGLRSFSLVAQNISRSLDLAASLGFLAKRREDGSGVVVGPDNYRFVLREDQATRKEPFLQVDLAVSDLDASTSFYTQVLRMSLMDRNNQGWALVGYPGSNQVPLKLNSLGRDRVPRVEDWEGRHAVSVPAEQLQAIYQTVKSTRPELIVHTMMELKEVLGILFIAIIKDPDGFEICLVSSETFDKAVLEADDFVGPDWEYRKEFVASQLDTTASHDRPKFESFSAALAFVSQRLARPTEMSRENRHFFFLGFVGGLAATLTLLDALARHRKRLTLS